MTRTLQTLIGVGLLVVLSGAPFVAVLCAGLCFNDAHEGHTSSSQPAATNCHGEVEPNDVVLSPAVDLPCADHDAALSGSTALAAGIRVDAASSVPGVVAVAAVLPPAPPLGLVRARDLHRPRASASAPSHTILRI